MLQLFLAIVLLGEIRPILTTAWKCSAQLQKKPTRHILIKKSECKLYLYRGKTLEKVYPIAVGKHSGDKQFVGDMRTPEGDFYIVQIQNSQKWTHDFKDGKGEIEGAYGPWFLRLYTGADRTKSGRAWKGIGIHGTHDESSIGTQVTEGCIRMKNADIVELKSLVELYTPVKIVE
ncbi:MAG: L,D-transpeptidase [Candidatus Thermochlorobacter aerophilum]|jgi:lipoprotein-anchoring transpeptidase ErfK/SrfK|uniref:L,D-transpeptidase n=1 Tax=Candidatus Thermochlorobacter aerophilus TaxID=1868324 RepID=A0A395M342_9BACT|nr:MAG: L,D-transpeptidase [Candidatus Thermochlorobacter aerophilum]